MPCASTTTRQEARHAPRRAAAPPEHGLYSYGLHGYGDMLRGERPPEHGLYSYGLRGYGDMLRGERPLRPSRRSCFPGGVPAAGMDLTGGHRSI